MKSSQSLGSTLRPAINLERLAEERPLLTDTDNPFEGGDKNAAAGEKDAPEDTEKKVEFVDDVKSANSE